MDGEKNVCTTCGTPIKLPNQEEQVQEAEQPQAESTEEASE